MSLPVYLDDGVIGKNQGKWIAYDKITSVKIDQLGERL